MGSDLPCVQVPTEESKEDSASQQKPWLLITDGEEYHIKNSMFNNKPLPNFYYDVGGEIPKFHGRAIGCSYQEWVLLYGSYEDGLPEVLVNLLTKETIELPLMDFNCDFCILTSSPSDPTCHVVFFNNAEEDNGEEENGEHENGEENENSLIIWKPGDKEFTIKKWYYEIFPSGVHAVVAGKLYLEIVQDGRYVVIVVEFKESTYRFKVLQMDGGEIEYRDSSKHYFFEYSGELFAVIQIMCGDYSSNLAVIKIFKADLLNKEWVMVQNLGRLAIFIGAGTAHAHCAAVDSGIAANSVYFLEDSDSYYVYNLEEGTIRMKPIFSSIETTEDTELDWIMMQGDPSYPKLLKDDQESTTLQDSEKEKKLNLLQLRLFGRDYAVFGGVCKTWQQSSIQDYSLLSSTAFLQQCLSFSPLLMYQEDVTSSYAPIFRFFDPVHRKLYHTIIPELREAHIQCSRDGWLLVSRRNDQSFFFINPLTQEKIELPRMFYGFTGFLSFSSPPTCSNCLVVAMNRFGSAIYTLRHGDKSWKEHEINYIETNVEEDGNHLSEYNIVVLNGLHYFMCENRDMVIVNLKNGAEAQSPDCQICPTKFRRSPNLRGEDFLVEIDGEPAFVSVGPNGGEISVSKWNDMEKDWELVEGDVKFGGEDMFLSKRCSFMEKSDDVGGMGNTIFPPMIDDEKAGVFYSLATRMYHTFCGGYSSELPYNVDKFLNGVWVKPDRKIVGQKNIKWFM